MPFNAGRKTNYYKNKVLDVLRGVNITAPTTVYLALCSDNPSDSSTGTELSGGSYSRKAITFSAASGGVMVNSADVVFDEATADWAAIFGANVMDASTGGNALYWIAKETGTSVSEGATLRIPAGELILEEDHD